MEKSFGKHSNFFNHCFLLEFVEVANISHESGFVFVSQIVKQFIKMLILFALHFFQSFNFFRRCV